jgi:predicted RNA-binding Zn ribbon-like protein
MVTTGAKLDTVDDTHASVPGASKLREDAPGELAIVQRFVNTLDVEDGTDAIDSVASLRAWLAVNGLGTPRARLGAADVRRAAELREAFRALLHANNGAPLDAAAVATVNAAARRAELRVELARDGRAALVAAHAGLDGAVARLLAIAHRAQVDGTWERLKACPEASCTWAFYDRSRNRSSTWCSMAVCGNRAKARSFRERRLSAGGAPSTPRTASRR